MNKEVTDNGFSGIPMPVETVADALGVSVHDVIIQAITDPENQPHQFVGDPEGLKAALTAPDQSDNMIVARPRTYETGREDGFAEGVNAAEVADDQSETIKALKEALEKAQELNDILQGFVPPEFQDAVASYQEIFTQALTLAENGGLDE